MEGSTSFYGLMPVHRCTLGVHIVHDWSWYNPLTVQIGVDGTPVQILQIRLMYMIFAITSCTSYSRFLSFYLPCTDLFSVFASTRDLRTVWRMAVSSNDLVYTLSMTTCQWDLYLSPSHWIFYIDLLYVHIKWYILVQSVQATVHPVGTSIESWTYIVA